VLLDSIHELDFLRWWLGDLEDLHCFATKLAIWKLTRRFGCHRFKNFPVERWGRYIWFNLQRNYSGKGNWSATRNVALGHESRIRRIFLADNRRWETLNQVPDRYPMNQIYVAEMRLFWTVF